MFLEKRRKLIAKGGNIICNLSMQTLLKRLKGNSTSPSLFENDGLLAIDKQSRTKIRSNHGKQVVETDHQFKVALSSEEEKECALAFLLLNLGEHFFNDFKHSVR